MAANKARSKPGAEKAGKRRSRRRARGQQISAKMLMKEQTLLSKESTVLSKERTILSYIQTGVAPG